MDTIKQNPVLAQDLAEYNASLLVEIGILLLQGNIARAESVAEIMPDRTQADKEIESFKERYSGRPHRQ